MMDEAYKIFAQATRTAGWLEEVRAASFARFTALGVPTTRNEEWKYTNMSSVGRTSWRLAAAATPDRVQLEKAAYVTDGPRAVLVNGAFAPALSQEGSGGVVITSLAAAMRTHGDAIRALLGTIALTEENAFAALNTAFLNDGAVVIVPEKTRLAEPLQIVHCAVPDGDNVMLHPRTLVIVGADSEVALLETHVGVGAQALLANAVTEIAVGRGATLSHCLIQRPSPGATLISTSAATVAESGVYRSCVVTDGGRLVRNTHRVTLAGAESRCELDGLYLAGGAQHVDNHTEIDHAAPRTSSRELYKGVLHGSARAVFNGKVFVRPAAQQTDARQTNKNLMLSATAQVDTKPQLEIWADDVKCTHGATVGQIDATSLFYLKTRGIGEEAAKRLLTYGFAHEILEQIPHEPLRARLETRLLETVEHSGDHQ